MIDREEAKIVSNTKPKIKNRRRLADIFVDDWFSGNRNHDDTIQKITKFVDKKEEDIKKVIKNYHKPRLSRFKKTLQEYKEIVNTGFKEKDTSIPPKIKYELDKIDTHIELIDKIIATPYKKRKDEINGYNENNKRLKGYNKQQRIKKEESEEWANYYRTYSDDDEGLININILSKITPPVFEIPDLPVEEMKNLNIIEERVSEQELERIREQELERISELMENFEDDEDDEGISFHDNEKLEKFFFNN